MITKLKQNCKRMGGMQNPTINVSQTTCIFPNCQDNTTPWIGKLQMEEKTLIKGGICCPTND